MEYQKTIDLLDTAPSTMLRFNIKKWIEIHDQSGGTYNARKQIRFKMFIPRSDLCQYSDAYIVVKGTITVTWANNRERTNRDLVLKPNAPFISCISKIMAFSLTEYLDVLMRTYNLIEFNKNYSKISGSLWNYRDEISDDTNNNNGPNKKKQHRRNPTQAVAVFEERMFEFFRNPKYGPAKRIAKFYYLCFRGNWNQA